MDGSPEEDWFRAERELREQAVSQRKAVHQLVGIVPDQ
jgi:hypothetical protein